METQCLEKTHFLLNIYKCNVTQDSFINDQAMRHAASRKGTPVG